MYINQDYKDEYLPMIQMSNDKYHSHPEKAKRKQRVSFSLLSFFSCREDEYKMSDIISCRQEDMIQAALERFKLF